MPNTTNIYQQSPDMDTTGGRLSRAREAVGLTVKQLAWRLGVKVSTIHAWESDRSQPGAHRMSMLSGLLGVSLSWILHGVGAAPVEASEDDAEESLEALAAQLDRLKSLHTETGQLIGRLQQDIARFGAER